VSRSPEHNETRQTNHDQSVIYKWVKEDRFPEPLILGQSDGKRSASRWKTSEVVEWLDSRPRGVQHELR